MNPDSAANESVCVLLMAAVCHIPRVATQCVSCASASQALRPDRLPAALHDLAASELGLQNVAPMAQSIAALADEASSGVPVLFVVTAGGDPSHDLRAHALKSAPIPRNACHCIAMTQSMAACSAGAARLDPACALDFWRWFTASRRTVMKDCSHLC